MPIPITNQSLEQDSSLKKTPDKEYANRLYALGRFLCVRRSYSFFQNLRQRLNPTFYQQRLNICERSLFEEFNIDTCVKQMRQEGVSFGLRLPAPLVEQIHDYALQTPCTEPGFDGEFFIEQIENGCLPCGHQVLRALVSNINGCDAIAKIAQNPVLLQIVHNYLHYWPTRITKHLSWSVASDLPDEEIRQLYPPATFHYDVAGFNFMTAYFYITDVDEHSGPHVMLKGSHHKKPLHMVLSSNRHPDCTVYQHYSKENEIVITGKPGFGFVQDPSCIHRVIPPVTANRLLLQIRYS